jgi:hypothetical protein
LPITPLPLTQTFELLCIIKSNSAQHLAAGMAECQFCQQLRWPFYGCFMVVILSFYIVFQCVSRYASTPTQYIPFVFPNEYIGLGFRL